MLKPAELEALLSTLCIDLGFCLSPEKENHLRENPATDIDGFTEAVFVAEGLNPQHVDRSLYRQVRDVVRRAYEKHNGASESVLL